MWRLLLLIMLSGQCGCGLFRPPTAESVSHVSQFRTASFEVEPAKHPLYVVSNGFHTGIILRRADVPRSVWPEAYLMSDHEWVEIGWGSEIFYRAKTITPSLVTKAFLPNSSVLHIVGWDESPEERCSGDVVRLEIDDSALREVCRHIHETYQLDDEGHPEYLGPGIYGDSAFFRGRGNYYFPNTCNAWTARALHKAGVPAVPQLSSLAQPVMFSARRRGTSVGNR